MANSIVTRGFSTGSNTSSIAFVVTGGYSIGEGIVDIKGAILRHVPQSFTLIRTTAKFTLIRRPD